MVGDDGEEETVGIGGWKTDNIKEFLSQKLVKA
jgi:hypothetical protein